MRIPSGPHFPDQRLMAGIKSLKLALPAQGLRMQCIALLALSDHGPNGMELPVFTKEMLTA